MARRFWTSQEEDKLKRMYGSIPNYKIAKLLDRTATAITSKAMKLGISKKIEKDGMGTDWKEDEEDIVRRYYGKIAAHKIAKKLPGRTVSAVYHRANRLGLKGRGKSSKTNHKALRVTAYYKWVKLRRRVYDRDENKCVVCGYDKHLQCHHIMPTKEGGVDKIENLVTLCPNHHAEADGGDISRNELRTLLGGV